MFVPRFATNDALVEYLGRRDAFDVNVRDALRSVDRKLFVEKSDHAYCYDDRPLSIGHDATISAPSMHSLALALLEEQLKPGKRALDVGCGSGILMAYLARMLDVKHVSKSFLSGIDLVEDLVDKSRHNLNKWLPGVADLPNVALKVGNGWEGDLENSPFDAIHVGAAAKGLPMGLLKQLRPNGGLMMLPYEVEHYEQYLVLIERGPEEDRHRSDLKPLDDAQIVKYLKMTSSRHAGPLTLKDAASGMWMIRLITEVCFVPLRK
eukprot:Gregarina_sp_Poly_1__9975@NODE_660_length_6909_cov_161_709880_g479_i1_p4_GENE_NODE_660_length_6909_cov_161_709880_g479_i1NODE_660_length_6909_cov_161_709880_g479_i1_p4_ORF_typecomplete_len264_score31_87PCMT/PF01135_19/5_6e48Methyltransf_31/PF13847_6/9_9e10PrmA/PF06325_13/9e09Methyltransf_25/PF13649_6/8_8e08Methyltransf_23/PF13489_6/8_4e08MTS/PF05175_14/2_8e07Methyltransf_18/PF12847_7/9_3e06CMAS/PF02353_20/1_7e05Ubie_methyltran/PF01209_18/6_1e05MetW/PF07021_12/0_00017Methyltransf_11/PF08241_12/0_